MKCLTLLSMAFPLISFDLTCLMCPSYANFWSMMTPRYFACCFISIGIPLSFRLILVVTDSFCVRNRIALDFLIFRLSLFAISHWET